VFLNLLAMANLNLLAMANLNLLAMANLNLLAMANSIRPRGAGGATAQPKVVMCENVKKRNFEILKGLKRRI